MSYAILILLCMYFQAPWWVLAVGVLSLVIWPDDTL